MVSSVAVAHVAGHRVRPIVSMPPFGNQSKWEVLPCLMKATLHRRPVEPPSGSEQSGAEKGHG